MRRKLRKKNTGVPYLWNTSNLSVVMTQVIRRAQKENGISWTIEFNKMKNSIRIDPTGNGGYQITATEGHDEYVARITRNKKSYMIAGSEILFLRILHRRLAES